VTVQLLVPLLLAACLLTIGATVWVPVLTLEVQGLIGFLLAESRTTDWSIAKLASHIPTGSQMAPRGWLLLLQVGFVTTCMITPLVLALSSLLLWTVGMRPGTFRRLLTFVEVVAAWSWLDVYVVIMITSLLSLNQFAQFTLGDECTTLNLILGSYPKLAELLPGEPVCLAVQPELKGTFALLFTATMLVTGISAFVMQAATSALRERAERATPTSAFQSLDDVENYS